jgi:REP element-mobilizing transposase RayT
VHVSFKFGARRDLRIHPALTALHQVLADLREVRPNFRVIAFSLQHDHLHILVEADSPKAFASGIRAFAIRAGKRLNQALGRTGRLFADRHHRRLGPARDPGGGRARRNRAIVPGFDDMMCQ